MKSQNRFYYLLIAAMSIVLINLLSSVLFSVLKRNLTLSCLKFLFHFKAVAQELKVDTYTTGRLSHTR